MMKNLFVLFALFFPLSLSAQGTFTEVVELSCRDTFRTRPLGYPTWNPPKIVKKARFGHAYTNSANRLVYEATPYYKGNDTVVVACARATQITCDTGVFIFKAACDTAANTVEVLELPCNDTLCNYSMASWGGLQVIQAPKYGKATIGLSPLDGPAQFCYLPNSGFEGTDFVLVRYFGKPRLIVLHVDCSFTRTYEMPVPLLRAIPNPTADFVRIALDEEPISVTLVHVSGISVPINTQWQNDYLLLDLQPLPFGTYWLCVHLRHGQRYAKLVVGY